MTPSIRIRNLREGEADTLPTPLLNHGMAYLIPEWAWVVELDCHPTPFALLVAAQAHSWLVLFRILSLSPLPPGIPLTWFLEALPQVFAEARSRGCVGFLSFLSDSRPEEVKLARIVQRMANSAIMPFNGSLAAGVLPGMAELMEEVSQ